MAATTRSARRTTAGRSRVREWATVTVQFSLSSSCAIGLPTMLERPITTASRPASFGLHRLGQDHAPRRRARRQAPAAPIARRPTLIGMKAVDVLGRIDGLDDLGARRYAAGSGSCTRMPCTSRRRLSSPISASSVGFAGRRGELVLERQHPGLARVAWPWCARRPGSPGPRRPAPRPGRATIAALALERLPRRRPPRGRNAAAMALPSMIAAWGMPAAASHCSAARRAAMRAFEFAGSPAMSSVLMRDLPPAATVTRVLATPSHCATTLSTARLASPVLGHGAHAHLERRPVRGLHHAVDAVPRRLGRDARQQRAGRSCSARQAWRLRGITRTAWQCWAERPTA